MISQKGRYAVRAVLLIAERGLSKPLPIGEIAAGAKIPQRYLEAVLLELRKRGLLRSVRGRNGGYMLSKRPENISFADILQISDSWGEEGICQQCTCGRNCRLREALTAARKASYDVLASQMIASPRNPG